VGIAAVTVTGLHTVEIDEAVTTRTQLSTGCTCC
jgi:hypothetical protein